MSKEEVDGLQRAAVVVSRPLGHPTTDPLTSHVNKPNFPLPLLPPGDHMM
jgi:hypothetical protein